MWGEVVLVVNLATLVMFLLSEKLISDVLSEQSLCRSHHNKNKTPVLKFYAHPNSHKKLYLSDNVQTNTYKKKSNYANTSRQKLTAVMLHLLRHANHSSD